VVVLEVVLLSEGSIVLQIYGRDMLWASDFEAVSVLGWGQDAMEVDD
jgi:hypothetical protein